MSIVLENVSHIYSSGTPYEQKALTHINLTIEKGEFVGIIGHTGSGKSTLIQHFNGLLKPTTGTICVDGVSLAGKTPEAKAARRKVGMVFQYPEHQIFEETIYQDIAFGPKNQGLEEEEIKTRIRESMEFVGLDFDTFANRSPFHLSGGQMRRVAIAGVLALKPEYLILDEPSAGLDPHGRDEILGQIGRLHEQTGMTVILVSHNMEDIARLADRLLVMRDGQLRLNDTPRAIFGSQEEELAAAGVSVPPVTLLLKKLRRQGLAVDDSLYSISEAAQAIAAAQRRQ